MEIKTIREFKSDDMQSVFMRCGKSKHAQSDRKDRFSFLEKIDGHPKFDKAFVVTQYDNPGKAVFAVSEQGVIYIFSLRKLFNNPEKSLVTAYIGNKSSISRLYEGVGFKRPRQIIENAYTNRDLQFAYNIA